MKKIAIKDMQLIVNKTNAANVTSTMMNLLRLYLTLSSYSFVFGITLLFVAANTKEKKNRKPYGSYNMLDAFCGDRYFYGHNKYQK